MMGAHHAACGAAAWVAATRQVDDATSEGLREIYDEAIRPHVHDRW